jgi:hypothetical protein
MSIFGALIGSVAGFKVGGSVILAVIGGAGGLTLLPPLYVGVRAMPTALTRYEFYDDQIAVSGPWVSRADYDDIAVAIRYRTAGDVSIDAASYELVREDAANLRIEHAPDPRRAEALLNTYLAPDEWIDRRERRDTALHALLQRWVHRSPPEREQDAEDVPSVIDENTFEAWMGIDPADATLRSLDRLHDVTDVSDIDTSDLEGAGDGDGAGDGGDGGGGGAD